MTLAVIICFSVIAGLIQPRRWALFLPLLVGVAGIVAVALGDIWQGDIPMPFVVLIATLAVAAGQYVRARVVRSQSPTARF